MVSRERPGGNVSKNVRDRVSATLDLFNGELALLRRAVRETRERVGIPGKPVTLPKKMNVPGVVPGLAEMPLAAILGIADHGTKFFQKQANITRRWVR